MVSSPSSSPDSQQLPPVLKEFTIFDKLPAELKFKIWRMALDNGTPGRPNVLEIVYNANLRRYHVVAPNPVLLSVCHASRLEALKVYAVLELELEHAGELRADCRAPVIQSSNRHFRTYIDYSSEAIYLPQELVSQKPGCTCNNDDDDWFHCQMHRVNLAEDFLRALSRHPAAVENLRALMIPKWVEFFENIQKVFAYMGYIALFKRLKKILIDHVWDRSSNYGRLIDVYPCAKPETIPLQDVSLEQFWHELMRLEAIKLGKPTDKFTHHVDLGFESMDALRSAWHEHKQAFSVKATWEHDKPFYERLVGEHWVPGLSEELGLSAEELKAEGYRLDWSGVEIDVVGTRRELWISMEDFISSEPAFLLFGRM